MKVTLDGIRYNIDVTALAIYMIKHKRDEQNSVTSNYVAQFIRHMFQKHCLELVRSDHGFVIFDVRENENGHRRAIYSQLETLTLLSKMIREFHSLLSLESKLLKDVRFQKSTPKKLKKHKIKKIGK
jgi:hypothetical protein